MKTLFCQLCSRWFCAGNFLRRMLPPIFPRRTSFMPKENLPTPRTLTKKFCKPARNRRRCCSTAATRNSRPAISARPSPRIGRRNCSSPRDAELRANLAFVRNQVQGATLRESRWQNWLGSLTLNEGAVLDGGFVLGDCRLAGGAADSSCAGAEAAKRDAALLSR